MSIPAGIDNGMRLRVRGEGEVGSDNGSNGDLYVEVHVKEHKYFIKVLTNLASIYAEQGRSEEVIGIYKKLLIDDRFLIFPTSFIKSKIS